MSTAQSSYQYQDIPLGQLRPIPEEEQLMEENPFAQEFVLQERPRGFRRERSSYGSFANGARRKASRFKSWVLKKTKRSTEEDGLLDNSSSS